MRLLPVLIFAVLTTALHAAELDVQILEDHTGNPLASVSVHVGKPGAQRLIADIETDTAGRFHIGDLYTGEYRIELSKPNYQPLALTVYLPDNSAQLTRIFRLVRGSSIAGQATDAQGKPIEAAHVYAVPKSGSTVKSHQFQTVTDNNGKYRLFNLSPGEYEVALAWGQRGGISEALPGLGTGVIRYPGDPRPTTFTISGGEQYQANFVIAPYMLSSIGGRLDRELKASEGDFTVALISRYFPGIALAMTQTKPDGSFRFDGIPGCDCEIVASGPSRAYGGEGAILDDKPLYGRIRFIVGGQKVENLVIPMKEGQSLAFRLSPSASNACPASAQLTLSSSREDWGAALSRTLELTATNQTLDHLAPAQYQASVEVPDHSCYVDPITIDLIPGDDDTLGRGYSFELKPGGRIQGQLPAGAAASDYLVVLNDADSAQVAVPDRNGAFHFDGLRPGKYRIAAEPSAAGNQVRWISEQSHMTEVTVRAGAASTVEIAVPEAPK
jgi:hypothetical protein